MLHLIRLQWIVYRYKKNPNNVRCNTLELHIGIHSFLIGLLKSEEQSGSGVTDVTGGKMTTKKLVSQSTISTSSETSKKPGTEITSSVPTETSTKTTTTITNTSTKDKESAARKENTKILEEEETILQDQIKKIEKLEKGKPRDQA